MDLGDPVDVLARTVWGEARGDGRVGMSAVAAVVLNRAAHPRWWGHNVLDVCLDPWQFSCWNDNDPNRPKLEAVYGSDPAFFIALSVAAAAVAGKVVDSTLGADSYFAVGSAAPEWASRATYTTRILRHSFYRVELPAPTGLPEAPNFRAPDPPDTADALMTAEQAKLDSQT